MPNDPPSSIPLVWLLACVGVVDVSAPARFRQSDITRAIKAAEKAGARVYAVEIGDNGTLRLALSEQSTAHDDFGSWEKDWRGGKGAT